MLKNFLKITLRHLAKYKGYNSINIMGLAVGLAGCLLISLWIFQELDYDKFYKDTEQIYAILADDGQIVPTALSPYLKNNIPEIAFASRVGQQREILCRNGDKIFYQQAICVDPDFLQIFSFDFKSGDYTTALNAPNSVIITNSIAEKYFPGENPIGQTLVWNNQDEFTVTGVITDFPTNSSLQTDMIVPIDYLANSFKEGIGEFECWNLAIVGTFIKTRPGVSEILLNDKLTETMNLKQVEEEEPVRYSLLNIADYHFHFSNAKKNVILFSIIALSILLMAAINFVNLTTARFSMRTKEVGMRKIIGAQRTGLIFQFLSETLVGLSIALFIALIILEITLPVFNKAFGLSLSLSILLNPVYIFSIFCFLILLTIATGIYPSLLLSNFHPVKSLQPDYGTLPGGFNLRRLLVVIQFTLSMVFIAGSIIIYQQLNYIRTMDPGYNKEQIINIPLKGKPADHYSVLKNRLIQYPDIISVTGAARTLPYWYISTTVTWDGLNEDEKIGINFNQVKHDFFETFNIKMTDGRCFSKDYPSDIENGCVINENLAQLMNRQPIIGTKINIWGGTREVIGIMKNFNYQSLEYDIKPLAFIMLPDTNSFWEQVREMSLRVTPHNIPASIDFIKKTWKEILPDYPFQYSFLDEEFYQNYKSAEQVFDMTSIFAALAIIISCLGLLGLASFSIEKRKKEIGIRKVLGAAVRNIIGILSKEYIILIGLSFVIACPTIWIIMNLWLEQYVFRIQMGAGVFLLVGTFSFLIGLSSVGFQAIKGALNNPIDVIRSE
ncbi:MAG: ABC transporter permease [Candidatus Zixiibacteriota bacterium]